MTPSPPQPRRTRSRSCSKPSRRRMRPCRKGSRWPSAASEAGTLEADAVDVILRDGTTLRLRAPSSDDAGALLAFFTGLSERSRYLRFHGLRYVDERLVEPFLDPDWVERGALV